MRRPIVAMTLLAALAPAQAAADDDISEFEARPTAIYAQVGLGTPLGFLGVEAEHTVLPTWSLSAGAGLGIAGPQAAAMVRRLFEGDQSKLVIGAGLSGGRYRWVELCFDEGCTRKGGMVAWANLEIGGEHRFRSGFAMKYFGGYGRLIAGDLVCDEQATYDHCITTHKNDGYNLIYAGVAFGYAF
jgi:hypothetical protein